MRLKLSLILPAAALLAVSLISSSALASPITGSFTLTSIGGTYVGGTATTATGLDFGFAGSSTGNGYGTNGTSTVSNQMGSFVGLTSASISDIALGAVANPYMSNPFLSFTGSNIVINFTNASLVRFGTGLNVSGAASFADGIAADANTGTFSLSTSSQGGSVSSTTFSFTSNASANPVAVTPEPSSLALLGTGLVGAASMALRRRKLIA